jgi:hypothetical protein
LQSNQQSHTFLFSFHVAWGCVGVQNSLFIGSEKNIS